MDANGGFNSFGDPLVSGGGKLQIGNGTTANLDAASSGYRTCAVITLADTGTVLSNAGTLQITDFRDAGREGAIKLESGPFSITAAPLKDNAENNPSYGCGSRSVSGNRGLPSLGPE